MLTTSEVLTIDGVPLNTYAVNISTLTGRFNTPDIRGDQVSVPTRSGYIFAPNRPLGPGEIILNMWVAGCDDDGIVPPQVIAKQQFHDNLESLVHLFTKRAKLLHVVKTLGDGSTRECYAEVIDRLEPEFQAKGLVATFNVAMNIPDVYWQSTDVFTQSGTPGSILPKILNLTTFSNMTGIIEDSILTVVGPITNPSIMDIESGISISLTGTLNSSQSWVVDAKNFTSIITPDNTNQLINTVHLGSSRFIIISPNNGSVRVPQLVLSGTGGGSTTNFMISARKKWLTP